MNKRLLMLAAAVVLSSTAADAAGSTFSGQVVSVVDGDTINVLHDGVKERVIFYGIDSPELGQDFGEDARKFTDQCCYKKTVTIEERGKDSHGRTIGVVFLPDGTNLNQELVKDGLAWWSDKYAPGDAKLKALHNEAKTGRKGLWTAPNPVPPWIWRNGERSVKAVIKSK